MKLDRQTKPGTAARQFPADPVHQRPKGSIAGWAGRINTLWGRGARSTRELAKVVCIARSKLRYGAWSQLWRTGRVRFSKRKGEVLVVIGQTLGNADAQISAQLRSAWNTLYYIARVGRPLVEQLIQSGRIHACLSLQAVLALLAEYRPQTAQTRTSRSKVKLRLAQFAAFVRATAVAWSPEERRLAQSQLVRLLEEIEIGFETRANHAPSQPTAIPCQRNGSPLAIHPLLTPQRL